MKEDVTAQSLSYEIRWWCLTHLSQCDTNDFSWIHEIFDRRPRQNSQYAVKMIIQSATSRISDTQVGLIQDIQYDVNIKVLRFEAILMP